MSTKLATRYQEPFCLAPIYRRRSAGHTLTIDYMTMSAPSPG